MSKFQGVLFTLKKRKQYPSEPDKKFYDFTTFGYYDGLSVSYTDQWYQFRPAGIAKTCGYVNQREPFTDIYVIKGFFPKEENLNSDLFSYSIWQKIGQKDEENERNGMCSEAVECLEQYPYICLSSIHLSQTFVKQSAGVEKMTDEVKKYLEVLAKNEGWNLRELHCAVFPIIGFSDYVIGFISKDFEIPTYCINKLKEWRLNNKAVISSCYTICGVYKDFKVTKDSFRADSGVRMIAEFSLREGVSAKEFHAAIRKRLIEKLKELQILEEQRRKVEAELENYYITFGNVDTLVVPNINIESYLTLFMEQEFQPGEMFYKNFIIGTKTSICVAEKVEQEWNNKSNTIDSQESNEVNIYKIHESWQNFSRDFESELKKRNYTVRMSRAIEQIVQNYYNIANTMHGFDIRSCLDDFISATLEDIRVCWEDEKTDWDELQNAIKIFRDKVGDFIADLLRSDKPFIEGNTLSHPAIGTATKILFAYTAILNKIAKQMGDNNQKIVFLVISGGADATTAIDLFSFLGEKKINGNANIRKPVLIVVPEKGLYDMKGTLFRLLHECMHFCGQRLRVERYELYLDIMAEMMAHDIVKIFFGESFIEEYLSTQEIYLPQKQYEDLRNEIWRKTEEWCEEIEEIVKKCIYEYTEFTNYRRSYDNESEYYENELFHASSVKNTKAGILSLDNIAEIWCQEKDSLSNKIEEIIKASEDALYRKLNAFLKENDSNVYAANIRARRLAYQKQNGEDRRIRTYLTIYGAVLVGNYSVGIWKQHKWWYGYEAISKLGFWSMRESRADFLAIRLLGMQVEEYLLAFIYEEENISRAMPITLDNVLRMGAVLKLGFDISKDNLNEKVRNKIVQYAKKMKKHAGYEYEDTQDHMIDYLNEYIDRIEVLLEEYEKKRWRGVAKNIEKYLQDISQTLAIDGNIEQLRKVYKQCDMTNKDDAYATIQYLFWQWEQLAKGDNNESEGCTIG